MDPLAIRPFLRWAGGKRALLSHILPKIVLNATGTYFEPFLGSGAVFFALGPSRAVLSDSNNALIATYQALKADVEQVLALLTEMKYESDYYYEVRSLHPVDKFEIAARFIYLNRSCFNGVYRVNSRGEFNVPFGRPTERPTICDSALLRKAGKALNRAEIAASDFEEIASRAVAGDFVYFDPPYTSGHRDNGFIEYNEKVFSWEDQERLAATSISLVKRGVGVLVSNAAHASIERLYADEAVFTQEVISRRSTISGSASGRFPTNELLICGSPGGRQTNPLGGQ